jgi:hypothetical protein
MCPRYRLQLLFNAGSQKANNSTTAEAREKIGSVLKSLEFKKFFDGYLTQLK